MTLFVYDGRSAEGPVQGEIRADNLQSAIETLRARQVEIYEIRPADWRESLGRHRVFLIMIALLIVGSTWVVRWTQQQQALNAVHMNLTWTSLDDGRILGIDPSSHRTVFTRRLVGVHPVDLKLTRDQRHLVVLDGEKPRMLAIDLTHLEAPPVQVDLPALTKRLLQLPNGDICGLQMKPAAFSVYDGTTLEVKGFRGVDNTPGDLVVTPDGTYWLISEPALDRIVVINNKTGRIVSTLSVGAQPDRMALGTNGHDLWVLCGDGNLRRVTLDFSHGVPTVAALSDEVSNLGGKDPIAIMAPAEDRCYVLNKDDAVVGVVAAQDLSLVRLLPTGGSSPCSWALSSTQQLWVANNEGQCLGIVDLPSDQSMEHVQLPGSPTAVEISSSSMSP